MKTHGKHHCSRSVPDTSKLLGVLSAPFYYDFPKSPENVLVGAFSKIHFFKV